MSEAASAGAAGASTSAAGAGSSSAGSTAGAAPATSSQPSSQGGNFQAANVGGKDPGRAADISAPRAGETEAQAQARILAEQDLDAFVELTVNGQKERVKVRDLTKAHGLDKAAQAKMQEAATMRKQLQAQLQKLQSMSLDDFARERKIDLTKEAEERLAQQYELANMTPEQREAFEAKKQLSEYRKMELSSKRQLAQQIQELTGEQLSDDQLLSVPKENMIRYLQAKNAEMSREKQSLEQEFIAAWGETGLPKHSRWGRLIAQELYQDTLRRKIAQKNGEEVNSAPLQAKDAAAKVKDQWFSDSREILGQMDAPAILSWLGTEIWQKLRDHDLKRVTSAAPFEGRQSPGNSPASEQNPKKYVNQAEWRKAMGIE